MTPTARAANLIATLLQDGEIRPGEDVEIVVHHTAECGESRGEQCSCGFVVEIEVEREECP